jgi:hypothetical protein
MKKIIVALLALTIGFPALAQEFKVTGEVKTGILGTITEDQIRPRQERTNAGSKDDAGSGAGRFRLNVEYLHGNLGFKFRINWETWSEDYPRWPYAFGYGNFFEDQLTVSIGKLGASPWSSGGPEMWKELEQIGTTGGMRIEYKPFFAPGLNVGFVINGFNKETDEWKESDPITFLHVLQESVIGASYTHEYFMARAAFKLDSKVDSIRGGNNEGSSMLYRVEERVIRNYLPGFSIWALGYYEGIGADLKEDYVTNNWLFFEYAHKWFNAQIRVGYDAISNRDVLNVRPNFYWKFFDNLINVGAQFLYAQDFGEGKVFEGSPYYYMEVEPKIQINFAPGAYAAFVYNYRREYVAYTMDHEERGIATPIKQVQWLNLRFGIYF